MSWTEGRVEFWIKASWLILAAVHLPPASVVVAPGLVTQLYGADPQGPTALLLVHRGVLFLAILLAAVFAAFDPATRRAASVLVGTSIVGFLVLYAMAGFPSGPLRIIALVDAVALLPLLFVTMTAWRS